MLTLYRSSISKVPALFRQAALLCLCLLVVVTIEIPGKAAVTHLVGSAAAPAGLIPTGVGLAVLLALRRQKKSQI